jgi:hypothetical protein
MAQGEVRLPEKAKGMPVQPDMPFSSTFQNQTMNERFLPTALS